MKKLITALVLVAMILSIFSMTAFAADQNTLTKAKYDELKASADFVEAFRYRNTITSWMPELLSYIEAKTPQYITEKEDDGYIRAAEVPANLLKDLFYEAFTISNAGYFWQPIVSPKGFFESDVLPILNKNNESFYNADKDAYRIFDPAMGGAGDFEYAGYVDNGNGTYSFYYAEIDWDNSYYDEVNEKEIMPLLDKGIAITVKPETDGIALVSDKEVDKLPSKYSEVPTATTGSETKVIYDTEKGITFADNNNFEVGTTVTAKEVKSGTAFDTAKKALNGVSSKFVVFDFSAVKNGATVQPNGKVKVTMNIPETLSADGLKMFYVSDKGEKENIAITVDKKNKTVTADLEHFSTYVLANVSTSPATGDNSNIMLWVFICVFSFAAAVIAFNRIIAGKTNR